MYRAYGLIQPTTDFSMPELEKRLQARFPDYTVVSREGTLTVAKPDWSIEMVLNAEPYVLDESEGIAENLQVPDSDAARISAQRVEVSSDYPDPHLEHFNDFLGVVETLKTFVGVLVVDTKERNVI